MSAVRRRTTTRVGAGAGAGAGTSRPTSAPSTRPRGPRGVAPRARPRLTAPRVYCRIRPFAASGGHAADTPGVDKRLDHFTSSSVVISDGHGARGQEYSFGTVFPPTVSQEDVFHELSESVDQFTGTNDAVPHNTLFFAYGQTGTGKTHTLFGPETLWTSVRSPDWGVIPRVVDASLAALAAKGVPYVLEVSAVQFYLFQASDLIAPKPVVIGDDHRPQALEQVRIHGVEDLLPVLACILRNRTTRSTRMNSSADGEHSGSSRSHAAVILTLHQLLPDGLVLRTTFDCVDLAGAERPGSVSDVRKSTQDMMNAIIRGESPCVQSQGAAINYELHSLRTAVIQATETHRKGRPLVPARMLTSPAILYLTGCMTGIALLRMIVCLSRSPKSGWETWFACTYGVDLSGLKAPVKPVKPGSLKRLVKDATRGAERAMADLERTPKTGSPASKYYARRLATATDMTRAVDMLAELARMASK